MKRILISILAIIILSLLLALIFFLIMQVFRIVFMGSISQKAVPWLYFIAYICAVAIVGIPYLLFFRKKRFSFLKRKVNKEEDKNS